MQQLAPVQERKYQARQQVRRLLTSAAARLAQARSEAPLRTIEGALVAGGTSHELAALAGLSLGFAQEELDNMRRRGELVQLGRVRSARGNRPLIVWGPKSERQAHPDLPGVAMLEAMMRGWSRGTSN